MFHRHASALVPTTIFVLLWSSGAIVSEIGLQYGSPLALLITRYAIAFIALSAFAIRNGQLLPARGSRIRGAITGLLIAGLYSACYLLALDYGVTPGALATLLGIQPILTIILTEREVSFQRLLGVLMAFGGLGLVAWDGIAGMRFGVAGLGFAALSLAGRQNPVVAADPPVAAANAIIMEMRKFEENGDKTTYKVRNETGAMGGMAPRAKILSLKVLDDDGEGKASNIIAALEYIQELNSHGRRLLVHGVNLSVGYGFEPAWFACGQSPVCVEVNRTVASGVVVVAAAGNTGYGYNQPMSAGPRAAGLDITINDPGNAEDAITVGSTHRDMPHVYGISYFSSKGPTGDGRLKPDLVAPGERILSCSSGDKLGALATEEKASDGSTVVLSQYVEDSGTSMAAPHVSGVIAAFLSARREFIGQPLKVKSIFMKTATDLGRERYFQGSGLVDLMRAIQSV